ncbi:MAG TPA: ATP-binding cassette domain-containing protein [Gammaproteobacteria bacterium]|nr:ATP-binding cassette domain-containing protein [Gammaproteobacteria bacterium]
MTGSLLSLREYGVAFGDKIILNGVNLDIPERGVSVLLGPAGTGKSTLLRTLSGRNNANPSLRTWGKAEYTGMPLGQSELPALVAQKTKLIMASIRENIVNDMPERHTLDLSQQRDVAQRLLNKAGLTELVDRLNDNAVDFPLGVQRHLAIARTVAANPRLILVDEPTAGLGEKETHRLLDYLLIEAERRAVVVVVHNQKQAIKLGGQTALLAGGWIHETQPTADFFAAPQSQAAKDFVRSGSCCVSAPDTPDEHLNCPAAEAEDKSEKTVRPEIPEEARKYKSDAFGPRNFLWLRKGDLAGTPRPGLLIELDYDLAALQRVGISVLVSLTTQPIDPTELATYDIKGIAFPIKDMGVPTIEAALKFCEQIGELVEQGEAVAMHCKAGMGRTGTMLAAQLIWEGETALDALETARSIEPRWVQSETQVAFLEEFALAVANSDLSKRRHVASS